MTSTPPSPRSRRASPCESFCRCPALDGPGWLSPVIRSVDLPDDVELLPLPEPLEVALDDLRETGRVVVVGHRCLNLEHPRHWPHDHQLTAVELDERGAIGLLGAPLAGPVTGQLLRVALGSIRRHRPLDR